MSCQGLVKFLLFFVNFIFSLIGMAIFGFGVYAVVVFNKMNDDSNNMNISGVVPSYFAPLVMTVGAIVFFVSFCACFGAIKEINCLLGLYSFIMFLLLAVKIAAAVYLFVSKERAENFLQEIQHKFPTTAANEVPKEFHAIEFLTKCCGTTGPNSYRDASIPLTCCPVQFGKDEVCLKTSRNIYEDGCEDIITNGIPKYINMASYTLIGIALFELASMISAMYLICYSRKSGGYYEYD